MRNGGAIDARACAQYPHQVGGHGQIIQADDNTILKPLVEKEARFYEAVWAKAPNSATLWLRRFTPQYFGLRELKRPESSPRAPSPSAAAAAFAAALPAATPPAAPEDAAAPPVPDAPPPLAKTARSYDHLRWAAVPPAAEVSARSAAANGVFPRAASAPDAATTAAGSSARLAATATIAPPPPTPPAPPSPSPPPDIAPRVSPWATQMADRKPSASIDASRVIVLEDVNRGFRYPCVADIKCGKRHYDDDATPEKQERHRRKAANTTTAATGIRYIGLQSLKHDQGDGTAGAAAAAAAAAAPVYQFRDKYHGRRLAVDDLIPGAYWFFHNGLRLRRESIRLTLVKLRQIADEMARQTHYKFYSSSLLLVYEGDTTRPPKVDVRMIDFAHTQRSNGERDDGYISGIQYLIGVLEKVLTLKDTLSDDKVVAASGGGECEPEA